MRILLAILTTNIVVGMYSQAISVAELHQTYEMLIDNWQSEYEVLYRQLDCQEANSVYKEVLLTDNEYDITNIYNTNSIAFRLLLNDLNASERDILSANVDTQLECAKALLVWDGISNTDFGCEKIKAAFDKMYQTQLERAYLFINHINSNRRKYNIETTYIY